MMPEVFRRRRRAVSSGALTIVSDSFTRADNAASLGTADSGQAWTALASTWGILSNQAYNPGAGSSMPAVIDAGVSDCTVLVTLAALSGGICFRAVDASNFWEFIVDSTSYSLWRNIAGSFTEPAAGSITGAPGDVLKVVLSGSNISLFRNGAQLGSTIIDASLSTATKHGLSQLSGSAATRWDNFQVTTP